MSARYRVRGAMTTVTIARAGAPYSPRNSARVDFYHGATLPDGVAPEEIAHLLSVGMIEPVASAEDDPQAVA